ncbi:hypothetical protein BT96DRAFT_1020783 [Gymnopus androsaceus JB14]|uniref:Uncharacterized protein n=1 Tax=Gymnopus androsaceus JB14 TaxID=1447944 RepID=A0A6A4HIP5_9AGAR|nr:hypothetical protein BT96DRAFT_1020783 [Gymnopus androsaceus JB14]
MFLSTNLFACLFLLIGLVVVNGSPINPQHPSPHEAKGEQPTSSLSVLGYQYLVGKEDILAPDGRLAWKGSKSAMEGKSQITVKMESETCYANFFAPDFYARIYANPVMTVSSPFQYVAIWKANIQDVSKVTKLYMPHKEIKRPFTEAEFLAYMQAKQHGQSGVEPPKDYDASKTLVITYENVERKSGPSMLVSHYYRALQDGKNLFGLEWEILTRTEYLKSEHPKADWTPFASQVAGL